MMLGLIDEGLVPLPFAEGDIHDIGKNIVTIFLRKSSAFLFVNAKADGF